MTSRFIKSKQQITHNNNKTKCLLSTNVKFFFFIYSSSGDRDYRGGNNMGNRSGGDRPRDNNRRDGPRREFNNEVRRDDQAAPKEPKREKVVKDFEERMPKFQAPAGPVRSSSTVTVNISHNSLSFSPQNLSVSNAFAGLDDEVDAD